MAHISENYHGASVCSAAHLMLHSSTPPLLRICVLGQPSEYVLPDAGFPASPTLAPEHILLSVHANTPDGSINP